MDGMSTLYTYIDGKPFIKGALVIEDLRVNELIQYIQKRDLKKVSIQGMDHFEFLLQCPSIEEIEIVFQVPISQYDTLVQRGKSYYKEYDLSPLYDMPNLKIIRIWDRGWYTTIDIKTKTKLDLGRYVEKDDLQKV